ncbi:hypothetical protein N9N12_00815 [Candidatus Poseidoniales archaeon]|nr:hypothetical protein [Candidatus Poseidoniales archaeon]
MAGTESTIIYAIGGGFLLLTLILLFMMYILMKKVSDLEDANDGVLSKLNISQKKGEAGEQLVASVTSSLIDAGILEQDVSLADKKSMDFASVIGTTEDGGTIYLPIDSKVNKRPTAVLDEIKKYIGRSYGDGIRTTPFAIIAYPDDEEGKYRKKRADAKKESVFFVRLSTLAPYLLFIRWYNDNIAPLQSANSKIAEALIVFRNHHATVEKEAYEVKQKLEKLIETIKYAPVGENLRHALQLAGIDSSTGNEAPEVTGEATTAFDSAYLLPDDALLSKLKISGFGPAKKAPILDAGYDTIGKARKLSLYDLSELGLGAKGAENFHKTIHQKTEE